MLAPVQATSLGTGPTAPAAQAVAQQLVALWHHCLKDAGPLYALLEELRVGTTDLKLLHHLCHAPADPTVKELAESMGLSLPGASRAADALLRRGWIVRAEDPQDRRMKRLSITPEGDRVLRRVEEARLAGLIDLIGRLPREHLHRLGEAIAPILADLEAETA